MTNEGPYVIYSLIAFLKKFCPYCGDFEHVNKKFPVINLVQIKDPSVGPIGLHAVFLLFSYIGMAIIAETFENIINCYKCHQECPHYKYGTFPRSIRGRRLCCKITKSIPEASAAFHRSL